MADETPQSKLGHPSAVASFGQETRERHDSVIDPALGHLVTKMSQDGMERELERELFGTPSDDGTSPQLASNEKRDSKTEDAHMILSAGEQPLPSDKHPAGTNGASPHENSQSSGPISLATLARRMEQNGEAPPQPPAQEIQSEAPTNGRPDVGSMGPPAAPASMLYNIRPSDTARANHEQIKDPFVCARLAAAVVTLFRMGKAKEAKAIGQFSVDLMGEEKWDEYLPIYMDAPAGRDDSQWVMVLLGEVATVLKLDDPASSGFLSILMSFLG